MLPPGTPLVLINLHQGCSNLMSNTFLLLWLVSGPAAFYAVAWIAEIRYKLQNCIEYVLYAANAKAYTPMQDLITLGTSPS